MLPLHCSAFCLKMIGVREGGSCPRCGSLNLNLHRISEPWQDSEEHTTPWRVSRRIPRLCCALICKAVCSAGSDGLWCCCNSGHSPENGFSWIAHGKTTNTGSFFPNLPLEQKLSMIFNIKYSHQFILNVDVACIPSGNMAFYPQDANHRVLRYFGEHLDPVVLVLKLLPFQGAPQELCPPLCFTAKVLIHPPLVLGVEHASLSPSPVKGQYRESTRLKQKMVITKSTDGIVSTSLTSKRWWWLNPS